MTAEGTRVDHNGRWSCCRGVHPTHRPGCDRLSIRDGDLHQWQEGDTYPHQYSEACPCGPERHEVYRSLSNPNWEGCLWKHPRVRP